MQSKYKDGFTLVELLVVIAIISLLSSVVLSSLNSARMKARDAQRMAEIKQFVLAIELYYDANGLYPVCSSTVCSSTGYAGDIAALAIVPTFIGSVPRDPTNVDGQYGYYYARGYRPTGASSFELTSSNKNYIIATRLENSSNPTFSGWNNGSLNVLFGQ